MRKNIAVITGGNSGEYEISIQSGNNIAASLDSNRYQVYLIHLRGKDWTCFHNNKTCPIDKNDFSLTSGNEKIVFDCVFIAIHGNPGEDGKLQGYFDMLDIPYTGCNAGVSALTFNKDFCNRVVASYGVKIAPSVSLFKEYVDEKALLSIHKIGFPCFVKPCNSGSSVGISKVNRQEELSAAIKMAFQYDCQVLVEQFIPGREITCGVVRLNNKVQALAVSEIISKKAFFDYEAKYNPDLASEITPAEIPLETELTCKQTSEKIYALLGCKGICRFDYIYNDTGLYFIEVNTIPGQTNVSIVPKQLRYLGLDFTDLCSSLIEEAIAGR
ncbi:MAG: D-alanine--D-alanine ligase [Bacteroidales bacterium]|jgi:D-alanine-D-alanine ligase|nr:D-alanine--D-alanine ligase [Bacteroidales bacterium]